MAETFEDLLAKNSNGWRDLSSTLLQTVKERTDLYVEAIKEREAALAERDALAAEVGRLREAGDAVLCSFGPDDERWFTDEMRAALNKLALLVLPEDDAARSLVEAPR